MQYIELYTTWPGQEFVQYLSIEVNGSIAYTFPSSLSYPDTAGRTLLVGTELAQFMFTMPDLDFVTGQGSLFPTSGIVLISLVTDDPRIIHDQVTFATDWTSDCNQSLEWPGPIFAEASPQNFDWALGNILCCELPLPCPGGTVCDAQYDVCIDIPVAVADPLGYALPKVVGAPNPFGAELSVRFSTLRAEQVEFDVRGRHVRQLHRGRLEVGSHRIAWDGRDSAGHLAPNGVYHVRVSGSAGKSWARVVRID